MDKIVLVTDAMAAHGLPKGKHKLGEMVRWTPLSWQVSGSVFFLTVCQPDCACKVVDVKEDRAVLEGTDTLAGSIVSMDECVQQLQDTCCISAAQAIEAASLHPAEVGAVTFVLHAHGMWLTSCGQ